MSIPINKVKPGDLITADTFNQILDTLTSFDSRISALESTTPGSSGAVAITDLAPQPPWQAGQDVTISGRNFGLLEGATVLRFDDVQVNAFKLHSNDSVLYINVPFLQNLPKDVVVSVSNGVTTDARTVHILPLQQPLSGNVDVIWNGGVTPNPNPNPLVAGQQATFAYTLRSRASASANFAIQVQTDLQGVQNVQILDANQNIVRSNAITLDAGQQTPFFVRFLIPQSAGTATFSLTVSASADSVSGSDGEIFTIGQTVQAPDTTFTLNPTAFTPNDDTGFYAAAENTISLRQSVLGIMTFTAEFTLIGTYDLTVNTVPTASGPTTNWATGLHATPSPYVISSTDLIGGKATRDPQIAIQPQTGASSTGMIEFQIQRKGATGNQTRYYKLSLKP